jgi:disulfide bond formation protein DsbB
VPVTGSASQNGAPVSTSAIGTTDTAGQLTLTGTFGSGDVGTWQESYLVGSGSLASVSFSVAPASTSTTSGTIPPYGTAPQAPVTTIPATGFDLSFLTNSISILGFNVPVWALIAAGGGLLLMSGGRKR